MTDSLHVVCPHCHTTNRIARAHLGQAPDCGKCHQPLFTGTPLAPAYYVMFGAVIGLLAAWHLQDPERLPASDWPADETAA